VHPPHTTSRTRDVEHQHDSRTTDVEHRHDSAARHSEPHDNTATVRACRQALCALAGQPCTCVHLQVDRATQGHAMQWQLWCAIAPLMRHNMLTDAWRRVCSVGAQTILPRLWDVPGAARPFLE
jgi:hypothetical protein